MSQNQQDVNGVLELVIDGVLMAHDARIGATEKRLRRAADLVDDGSAECAYIANVDAINVMWRAAVDAAFWTGYKLGQDD